MCGPVHQPPHHVHIYIVNIYVHLYQHRIYSNNKYNNRKKSPFTFAVSDHSFKQQKQTINRKRDNSIEVQSTLKLSSILDIKQNRKGKVIYLLSRDIRLEIEAGVFEKESKTLFAWFVFFSVGDFELCMLMYVMYISLLLLSLLGSVSVLYISSA